MDYCQNTFTDLFFALKCVWIYPLKDTCLSRRESDLGEQFKGMRYFATKLSLGNEYIPPYVQTDTEMCSKANALKKQQVLNGMNL